MAAVYKQNQSLWSILLLMIMSSNFSDLTFATKVNIHRHRMQYSESGINQFQLSHNIEKRKVQLDLPKHKPHFSVVKAQTWSTVTLHCETRNIEKKNVTLIWSKKQSTNDYFNLTSLDIIFVHNETETAWVGDDKRYQSKLMENDWRLNIGYTQNADAGIYQCQICTTSKCSTINVWLKLTESYAKIIGGPTKVIPSDKELPLRLSCMLINSMEKPAYIFWYHGDRMINYDLEDGATVREGPQGSELIFQKANKTHVGNYSCVPSNAKLDSVTVYYGDDTSVYLGDGNSGKKTNSEDPIFNMLVLISIFLL